MADRCFKCDKHLMENNKDFQFCAKCNQTNNYQLPNFRAEDGTFYLLRCYACRKYRWEEGVVGDECPKCHWKAPPPPKRKIDA